MFGTLLWKIAFFTKSSRQEIIHFQYHTLSCLILVQNISGNMKGVCSIFLHKDLIDETWIEILLSCKNFNSKQLLIFMVNRHCCAFVYDSSKFEQLSLHAILKALSWILFIFLLRDLSCCIETSEEYLN